MTETCGKRAQRHGCFPGWFNEKGGNFTHLVSRKHHGGESYVHAVEKLKPRLVEEQRAAVGAVVALDVQARGPGLGAEVTSVAQACQNGLEGVVIVVDFLQTQDVRSEGEDLL